MAYSLRCGSGVLLLLAVLAWLLVRDHPGRAGLPSMRELDGKLSHAAHTGHWYDGLLVVLKNRYTWPGLWVNMGLAGSLFAFAGLWAVPFLRDVYGMDRAQATAHTTLLLRRPRGRTTGRSSPAGRSLPGHRATASGTS